MATIVDPFSDEQARTLVNLDQRYQVWMAAEQALHAMPYNLVRKEIKGRQYLYELVDRTANGRSLGPWSPELAARFETYQAEKAAARLRRDLPALPRATSGCRIRAGGTRSSGRRI